MKHRIAFINLPLLAVFLVLASTAALASNTWYVDGLHGSDSNNCKTRQHACKTIGHAISLAHSGDSIMVAAATYTEHLTISFSLKMIGSSASSTIIDGGGAGPVVGISSSNARVTLSKLTIYNGRTTFVGGGINNGGTLIINSSLIAQNVAVGFCFFHHCFGGRGGGIYNGGTLTINNSTISGNAAIGNLVSGFGGDIYNGGTLTINNSTISGNSASTGGGIDGTATLQNSIVANNSGRNCYGTMTSNGYNLSSDKTCHLDGVGDMNNTGPKLGKIHALRAQRSYQPAQAFRAGE